VALVTVICTLTLKCKAFCTYAMKLCKGIDARLHSLLTSALGEKEWLDSRYGRFYPGRNPHYSLETKLCCSQRQSVVSGKVKNWLHVPEMEPRVAQCIVWSLSLLSYFGPSIHSPVLLSECWSATGHIFWTCPITCKTREWLPRVPAIPHALFIFQLGFPASPPPRSFIN
jgi:hypothetical protein